ncbi:MAG: hypothetical protein Q9196_000283 [Gyalolechia fulgens]
MSLIHPDKAHAGFFHLLPLGLRVQEKLERLIDKHMSKLARKYRDEARPRQGLLRTREFLMKDLYTFDVTLEKALVTYRRVCKAYDNFFNELRIRFVIARAASGDIGGSLSHEYHIPTTSGEDTLIQCGSCTYAANEEWLPENAIIEGVERTNKGWGPYHSWFSISRDRTCLVEAILPPHIRSGEHLSSGQEKAQINPHLIKAIYPDLDLSIERPLSTFIEYWKEKRRTGPWFLNVSLIIMAPVALKQWVQTGDECPDCGEKDLKVLRTLELGHTFHLGQRYSKPMNARFAVAPHPPTSNRALAQHESGQEWFYMGCHGIGISRMIAAVADSLADERGLIWPRAMAPYEAVILATEEHKVVAEEIWDLLTQQQRGMDPIEAILDDRDKSLGWKLKDADLIGFPIVIILGSMFGKDKLCEVSIRRLGLRDNIMIKNLREYIDSKLADI